MSFLFKVSKKRCFSSHIQSIVLSLSFCWTTYLSPQLSSYSVGKLHSIHCHIGRKILHTSSAIFYLSRICCFFKVCLVWGIIIWHSKMPPDFSVIFSAQKTYQIWKIVFFVRFWNLQFIARILFHLPTTRHSYSLAFFIFFYFYIFY